MGMLPRVRTGGEVGMRLEYTVSIDGKSDVAYDAETISRVIEDALLNALDYDVITMVDGPDISED